MSGHVQQAFLKIAEPPCAAEDMGDEIVALNVETGVYFSIRDLGVAVWRDLAAGHGVEELAGCLRAATGSDASLRTFVDQVLAYGLMSATEDARVVSSPTIVSRLRHGQGEIVLEVFEDMKDLILSDPIHDVDETVGWPRQPSQIG